MRDIDEYAKKINKNCVEHGFWDQGDARNFGEMLMLATSELAEALEEHRAGKPLIYWKCSACGYESPTYFMIRHNIPDDSFTGKILRRIGFLSIVQCDVERLKPEGVLVEIADAIIRLMDTGHHFSDKTRFSLGWVIEHKMEYNEKRERMHGKAY